MDIKGLINRERQRSYLTNDAYLEEYRRRVAEETELLEQTRRSREQERQAEKELEERNEQKKREYNKQAKELEVEDSALDSLKKTMNNWADLMKDQPKWFSTIDSKGNIRSYFTTPKEVEATRNIIGQTPQMLRSSEDSAYYEQLSPSYIQRANELWDVAQTYKDAQEGKIAFQFAINALRGIQSQSTIDSTQPFVFNNRENIQNARATAEMLEKTTDDSWLDDAFASYVQKKNVVEVETDAGIIIRNAEKRQYLQRVNDYSNNVETYLNLYDQYLKAASGKSNANKDDILNHMNRILESNKALESGVKEAITYSLGSNFGSSVSTSVTSLMNIINNNSKGGILDARAIIPLNYHLNIIKNLSKQSISQMDKEDAESVRRANKNQQELRAWQAWHTPSAEYLANEQAAQSNMLSQADTYLYSMPGVMGSSASFNGVQLLGGAFNTIGQLVSAIPHPVAKAAGAASIAAGAGFNIAAGVYENSAEVASNYKNGLIEDLKKEGLYDKFIKDGRKQLEEKNEDFTKVDDEIVTAFLLKKWIPDDPKMRNIAIKHLFGANNMFQNDMMATTADVAFNTSLSLFAPYGPLAKSTKFTPIPKSESLKRLYRMQGKKLYANMIDNYTKESGIGRAIADGMSPIAGQIYRVGRSALTPVTSRISGALKPIAEQFANKVGNVVEWSKVIPGKLIAKEAAAKNIVDFAGRTLARGFSEAVEEGKQHEYGERFARGEFAGNNRSILDTFVDDLSTGVSVGFKFLGHQLLGLETDKDLMAEMRGGFLGGLFNQGTLISAYQAGTNTYKKVNMADAVYTNLLAEKYKTRSSILNAENFAKYHTQRDYDTMMETFDRFKSVMSTVRDEKRKGFTDEDIENAREQYRKVYRAANNVNMQAYAALRGIQPHSKLYRTFVALANYIHDQKNEVAERYNQHLQNAQNALAEYGITIDQFNNLENIVNNGLQDPSLTEKQKQYLQDLHDTIIQENPSILPKNVINFMRNIIAQRRNADQILAEYAAYKSLVSEMESLKETLPEVYEKHKRKAEIYKQNLELFLSKGQNQGLFDEYETGKQPLSELEDLATDKELFHQLSSVYRMLADTRAEYADLEYDWMNLVGVSSKSEQIFENDSFFGNNSSLITNSELNEILKSAHSNYEHQRNRLRKTERVANDTKSALQMINRFKDSVDEDDKFVEEINRDFRETQQRRRIDAETRQTVEEQSNPQDYNPFVQTESRSRAIAEQFINQADEKDRKEYEQDLLNTESVDGMSQAEESISLYSDDVQVIENEGNKIDITDDDGVTVRSVPIDKKFTYRAIRPNGTTVYITKAQAKFIEYLQKLNDTVEEEVEKRFAKSKYSKPETTSQDFEDQVLDALVKKDKKAFDDILNRITQYISDEKLQYFKDLWERQKVERKEGLVPIEGTKRTLPTDSKLLKSVRQAVSSCMSVITILGNYQNAIPKDEDLEKHFQIFQTTIGDDRRKQFEKESLRRDGSGISKQKQIEFYINAGFTLSTRKTPKSVRYEVTAPTGETYSITKYQYEYGSWLKYYKDRTNDNTLPVDTPKTDMSDRQKSTLELLKTKLSNENPSVIRNDLRTSRDYFIVENGHLVRYGRVHSFLRPQYEKSDSWKTDYNRIVQILTSVFTDKEKYKEEVIKLQDRFNTLLAQQYGDDSDTYKNHSIDLSVYLTDDIINDRESIKSISYITALGKNIRGNLKLDLVSRAVVAGQILDEICRSFFAGNTVINKPEYKMSQTSFDQLITDLTEQKKLYEDRGWVLSTEPYCWHCVLADGTKIAGETDMIGIDKEGDIHIIDFKTSKYSFAQEQALVSSPLSGQEWIDVTQGLLDENLIPANAERRIYNRALDNKNKTQSITAREAYEDQQTTYANMIRASLEGNSDVKSIELLTFQVRTKAGINEKTGEYDEVIFGGFANRDEDTNSYDDRNQFVNGSQVKFQGSVQLNFSKNINHLRFVREDLQAQRNALSNTTQYYNQVWNRVNALLVNMSNKISTQSKQEFDQIQNIVQELAQKSTSNSVLLDKQAIEKLITDIQGQLNKLEELESKINQEIQKYDEEHKEFIPEPTQRKLNPNRKQSLGQTVKFNCLDIFDERFVDKDLARVSAYSDFMQSAVFEIDTESYEKSRAPQGKRIATPTVYVNIYYDEHLEDGTVKHHKFDRIKLLTAKQDPSGVAYSYGLDGNNTSPLLAKIEAVMANPENKGKRVILTSGSRTNGIVKYNGETLPIQQTFGLSEEDMEQCLTGTQQGSVLGINKRGSVYMTSPGRGNLTILHGIDPDRALTDGMMSWYLNLAYDEDNGSKEHSIPVTLTPKPLKKSDVEFIIDLLKNFTKKRKIQINGKEYDSPISNSRLLRTIIRFGRGAEETGNRFRLNWANLDENGYSTDGYRTIRITKYKQDDPTQVEYDYMVDLQNDQHVEWLRNTLLNEYYVYANNEYAMWHATTSSRDASSANPNAPMTNPFVGLEQFFKSNPELTEGSEDVVIEFSESFKFRRSDVDPNLDGSYSGINGIHWMMRNGWLETNFSGIVLPMISFNDVQVQEQNTQETSNNAITKGQPVPEIKQSEGVGEASEWANVGDSYIDGEDIEFKLQQRKAEKPLDREQAEKRLKWILGKSFSIEFQDKALDMFEGGWLAVAGCKADAIVLTDYAENGVEFHEAFHAVVDLIIGEKRRKALYDHYNSRYGNSNLTESQISEGLADMYYEFRQNTPIEWSWNILKTFSQIGKWVSELYNLNDRKLAWLFFETNLGIFRNRKPDPKSIKSFRDRNKDRGGYEPYTIKDESGNDVQLKRFTSFRQINDAVDGILYRIIRDYGIDNLATNIENLRTDKESLTSKDSRFAATYQRLTMANKTDAQIDEAVERGFITEADKEKLLKYRELFDNWETIRKKYIIPKLNAMGVDSIKKRKQAERDNNDGGTSNAVHDDITGHSDEFYTHARSEDVSTQVHYFLSTIPSVRWLTEEDIKNGMLDPKGNPYTSIYRKDKDGNIMLDKTGKPIRIPVALNRNTMGEITFQNFQTVYQKLLKNLYNVKDVQDLLDKLDVLGESDYIFYHVKKSLFQFRYKSYLRYDNGIPKVIFNGKLLDPKEYISNPEKLTNQELYPKNVRYTHDVVDDESGKILHRKGDIIQGAVILTDADYEAITTQIYQAVKSQKLNFVFCYESSVLDEDGEIIQGKHKYNVASTNTQSDSRAYPVLWFNRLRSMSTGVFEVGDESQPQIDSNFKEFENTRQFLLKLSASFAPNLRHKVQLDDTGKRYNIDNDEDFDKILSMFVSSLNNVGIMIDKPTIIHMLTSENPEAKIQTSFERIFTTNEERSISTFIKDGGVLDKLQKAVDEQSVEVFTQDVDSKENKKVDRKAVRTGSYMYSLNGFVISMATAYSNYRSAAQEMMVLGPDNTRMYTFAQNHSASDTTYELNTCLDENGNVVEGNIMADLQNVSYITIHDGSRRIGSIIAKSVLDANFNKNRNRIQLHTSSGIKTQDSRNGGVKYSEITEREDYINKAVILRDGNIVFPTLSDKSTWFYLSGIKLPGLNWDAKTDEEFGMIPTVGLTSGRLFFGNEDNIGDYKQNPVLDQMIEYALCELANIEKTIDDLGLNDEQQEASQTALTENKKVKNYHTKGKPSDDGNYKDAGMHGARFFFLTGIYDERTGKYIDFNKILKTEKDLGVVKCYQLAKQYFFDKVTNPKTGQLETDEELRCRQRSQIAKILQKRLDEELDYLVEKGIIQFNQSLTSFHVVNKNGVTYRVQDTLPKYFGYVNKYLDDTDIQRIANIYRARFKGKYNMDQCRSLATVAYIFDINNKSIMSMEETERIYTGMPQFFKCKYDKEGHLIDRGEDESKRYGGEGSTGSNNREDLPNISDEYSCAEIKDWEVKSSVSSTLTDAFIIDEYKDALATRRVDRLRNSENYSVEEERKIYEEVYAMGLDELKAEFTENERTIIDAKIKAEASAYEGGINVADGTAYVTDRLAENLLRVRGAYSERVKEAFEYLRGDRKATFNLKDEKGEKKEVKIKDRNGYLTSAKAYKIIYDALISTQKYSAFGFRMENGVPVHFYNKYALFPVFEGMSYGFTHRLYEKMNDEYNPVDMVMFDSAVKSGSEGAQKFNPDMSPEELDAFSFKDHIYRQKFKFIRRQLNTDPRTDEIMTVGTQAGKIVLSTLRDGQMYTLRDGTQMTGSEIKARVMDAQNELSNRGRTKFIQKFFINGNPSIDALSEFFKEELMSRDADKNILDALEVVEDPVTHEKRFKIDINAVSNMAWAESIMCSQINKQVIDINLPGNAFYQRSVFGMEGPAIVSDEYLKNNKQDYLINGGKPLQMINEKGSMDAVVSIDYFMHLIPENIRYNFAKARQFLIDNKIIGPDAEANTMAYRIPTQAVSSVHALRFVDVLPIVRDTIVLPKEFTRITGSDFDIDKLYMSTLNYRLVAEEVTEYKDGKEIKTKKYHITKEHDIKSDEQLQNELMSYWFALLEDAGKQVNEGEISISRYMHMLHRSIDNDTALVDNVLKKIESNRVAPVYEPMQFGSLHRQIEIKNSFITGKQGIGPFALNNNSHILTMLYNVNFAKTEHGILDVIGMRSLGKALDRDGNSILSWLSAMINIHVDAAKDPKAIRLNINQATYNLTNLLLRIGLGEDALNFLSQPIVKGVAQTYINSNGSIVEDPGLSPKARSEVAEARYIKSITFKDATLTDVLHAMINRMLPQDERTDGITEETVQNYRIAAEPIIKALFSIDADGEYVRQFETLDGIVKGKSILEDLLTNKEVLIDPNKSVTMDNLKDEPYYVIDGTQISPRELQAYVYIAKQQFEVYAQAMSDIVTYTKIDTKKQGKNFQEQRNYRRAYDRIHDAFKDARENNTIPNTMFDENLERMLDDSFIDTKTHNGTELLPMVMGNLMIHMTDTFQDAVDRICEIINNRTNKTKGAVNRALLSYIKQKCMNRYMNENNIDFRSMISGSNTLSARIDALKRKMLADTTGKYSDFIVNGIITNTLLDNIRPVPYVAQYGQEYYDILTLDNVQSDDEQRENDYIDSWQQLLESEDEEIRNIGNDLAVYAFMTSGDNPGFTKFFKYVPDVWREQSGYAEYIRQMKDAFVSGNITIDGNRDSFFNIDSDEFIRNNWTNSDIVPVMTPYTVRNKTRAEIEATGNPNPVYEPNYTGHKFLYKDLNAVGVEVDKNADQIIAGIKTSGKRIKVTISINPTTGSFPPYIKMRRRNSSTKSADPYMLYKLVATGIKTGDRGKQYEYPIYALTYPKGFSIQASGQRYDFYEYERDDQYTHIFDPSVMIGDEYGQRLETICAQIQQYVDSYGSLPVSLGQVLGDGEFTYQSEEGNTVYDVAYDEILRDIYMMNRGRVSQSTNMDTGKQYPGMPEFNKLPAYTGNTMSYAGIGSRRTEDAVDPDSKRPILEVMEELATELESLGYKLNSGHAEGPDQAFEKGVKEDSHKQIFTKSDATSRTYKIAREVHPNWKSLGAYAKGLQARNTFQVFGRDLDKPVDFVLCYTPDGAENDPRTGETEHLTGYNRPGIPNTGGTGQAISMASMKGIPVINMANPGWRARLDAILARSKQYEPESYEYMEDSGISGVLDTNKFQYSRYANGRSNYEVSSKGDNRFSAMNATFAQGTVLFGHDVGGRTIESVYQHGVKQGDWITDNNKKTGAPRDKTIITGNTENDSYAQGYLPLWQEWARQNPQLIEELRQNAQGKILTDMFASTAVSQARALTDILNSTRDQKQERKTEMFGVIIDPNLIQNYRSWLQSNPNGIVAYRVNKQTFNTAQSVQDGIVGNPFDWNKYGTEKAVSMFYTWLVKGTNFGEPLANEQFRQAVIQKILNSEPDTPILYYKELGMPSHATVIGYLINNKQLLQQQTTPTQSHEERIQSEEFYSKQDVQDYINDLVNIEGISKDNIEVKHISETETEDEYWTVTVKTDQSDQFNDESEFPSDEMNHCKH